MLTDNTPVSASPAEVETFPSKDLGPKKDLVNYPYDRVKINSHNPVPDIDITMREVFKSQFLVDLKLSSMFKL